MRLASLALVLGLAAAARALRAAVPPTPTPCATRRCVAPHMLLDTLTGTTREEKDALLTEPFPSTREGYGAISEAFNRECYQELFEWIPKFKEQGGFSTFRFDDFLDIRIRSIRPSVRKLLLRATLPLTLGVSWEEATRKVESEALASVGIAKIKDLASLYDSYAQQQLGSSLGGQLAKGLSFLPGPAGGTEAKLQGALATLAGGGDGAAQLRTLLSSVEQTTGLVCNMLAQTEKDKALETQLAKEQEEALDGWGPENQIGMEQLAAMPQLDAFTLETLRLQPPAGDGFAGPQGGAGAELATTLAKVTYVQMRRMFVLRIGADPPLVPTGDDVRSISEGCKVLAEARMYYELKRENKKLRF